jgi:DNA-directed RNA polymerase subunit K/omega
MKYIKYIPTKTHNKSKMEEEEVDDYADLDEEEQNDDIDDDKEDDVVEPAIDDDEKSEEIDSKKYINEIVLNDKNHQIIEIVPDDERITSDIIQLPEITAATGTRAAQIERGAPVFVEIGTMSNPIVIARVEFAKRKSPFILMRVIEHRVNSVGQSVLVVEHWKVREMIFPENINQTLEIEDLM